MFNMILMSSVRTIAMAMVLSMTAVLKNADDCAVTVDV